MVHIIVTGSRDATTDSDWEFIFRTLNPHFGSVESLTHGGCKGPDLIAAAWLESFGLDSRHVKVHEFLPDWASLGKAAGPRRNAHMVRETIRRYGLKDTNNNVHIVCLAFTNKPLEQSRGTANCLQEAERKGIITHHFRTDLQHKEF